MLITRTEDLRRSSSTRSRARSDSSSVSSGDRPVNVRLFSLRLCLFVWVSSRSRLRSSVSSSIVSAVRAKNFSSYSFWRALSFLPTPSTSKLGSPRRRLHCSKKMEEAMLSWFLNRCSKRVFHLSIAEAPSGAGTAASLRLRFSRSRASFRLAHFASASPTWSYAMIAPTRSRFFSFMFRFRAFVSLSTLDSIMFFALSAVALARRLSWDLSLSRTRDL
mmetsp:Transcript_31556/g.80363  ORF Transcript_31556/g.80363 Transcript_31556/m.80363 type:complete len:219 (+) Transcript_31556:3518-4174(+)